MRSILGSEPLTRPNPRKDDPPDGLERSPPSYILQQSRILDSATRRYLAAIRDLARLRKLEATAPPVQVNTQVNVLGD